MIGTGSRGGFDRFLLCTALRAGMLRLRFTTAILLIAAACQRSDSAKPDAAADASFSAMQDRGAAVMGVDQYASQHVFEDLSDGGRIVLDLDDTTDTPGITAIRRHMHAITSDFQAGDFSKPFLVHAEKVPGTDIMAARHDLISYHEIDRPAGAEVRIQSGDSVAVNAIHTFLAYQRSAHHAMAHEMNNDSSMEH